MDDAGLEIDSKKEIKILSEITDLTTLYSQNIDTQFIIVDLLLNYRVGVLTEKSITNGKIISETKKKVIRHPQIAKFTFNHGEFFLNKFFKGELGDMFNTPIDDGGEIFSKYRLFRINDISKDLLSEIQKILGPSVKYNPDMIITNDSTTITSDKYKEKYLKYKTKYTELKSIK